MKDKEHRIFKEAIKNSLPNQEKIKRNVLDKAEMQDKKRSLRWLMPVAACALAAVIICTSVPSVRAAIAQWFSINRSVQNYVAQPEEDRPSTPELDVIIEETKPKETMTVNSIEIINVVPEWQEWADSLNPIVGDVFFDGQELIVAADFGSENIKFGERSATSLSLGSPGYILLNGVKYAYNVFPQGVMFSSRLTATIDFTRSTNWNEIFSQLSDEHKAGYIEEIEEAQKFDPEYTPLEFVTPNLEARLVGVQEVEVNLPLVMTDFTSPTEKDEQGTTYQGRVIGLLKMRFSFDPEVGYEKVQNYEINQTVEFSGSGKFMLCDEISEQGYMTCCNKTIDMSGVKMTAKHLEVIPSGAELYIGFIYPDSWSDLEKNCFMSSLHLKILGDGAKLQVSGNQNGLADKGEDFGISICLNMLPSELEAIESFEILPILSHYIGYDDIPYVEGEPTRIKLEEGIGYQTNAVELDNCKLDFTLK